MSFTTFQAPGADLSDGNGTYVNGLNNNGDCCGFYLDSENLEHGFVRLADGTFPNFDPGGTLATAQEVFPYAINDSGVVSGYYNDSSSVLHGFVRAADGTITTFDPPDGNQIFVGRGGIDSAGNIYGWLRGASYATWLFKRATDGTFTVYASPLGSGASTDQLWAYNGGDYSYGSPGPYANDSGDMAFSINPSGFRGVLLSGGTFTLFDGPGSGSTNTGGVSINSSGYLAGRFSDSSAQVWGFIRHPDGTFDTFQHASGDGDYFPFINDSGNIAGTFLDGTLEDAERGFTRSAGGSIAVFDAPGATTTNGEGQGTFVMGFNNGGTIAGYVVHDDGGRFGLNVGFIGTPDDGPPPPPPPLRYKKIPQTLDLASTTFDQANRLALYELCRMCGLDSSGLGSLSPFLIALYPELSGAPYDPPTTLTLDVWAEAVDASWNILKSALLGAGGGPGPLCGRRISIDASVSAEYAGDYEVMAVSYQPFLPDVSTEFGSSGGGVNGIADTTGRAANGAGVISLTLRTYDERWLSFDASQTPSYLNLPGPIDGDEVS